MPFLLGMRGPYPIGADDMTRGFCGRLGVAQKADGIAQKYNPGNERA